MPDFSWYRPQDYVMGGMQQAGQGISQGISAMEAQRQQQAPSGIWESEFAPQGDPVQQEIDEAIKKYPQLAQLLDDPNTPMESIVSIVQSLRQQGQQPQGQPQPQAPQMPQMPEGPAPSLVSGQQWDFPTLGLPGGVPYAGGQAPAPQITVSGGMSDAPTPYQQAPQPQRVPMGGPDMKPRAEPTGTVRILGNGNPDRQLTNKEFGKKMQMMPFLKNRETLSQKDRYMQTKFKSAKDIADQASADKRYGIDAKSKSEGAKNDTQLEAIKQRAQDSLNDLQGALARADATVKAAGMKGSGAKGLSTKAKARLELLKDKRKEVHDLGLELGKFQRLKPAYDETEKADRAQQERDLDKLWRSKRAELTQAQEEFEAVADDAPAKPAAQAGPPQQGGPPPAQGGDKVWVRTTEGQRKQVSRGAAATLVKAGRAKVE